LLEQLRLFPKAAYDDGPHALEMAVAAARQAAAPVPFKFESAGTLVYAQEGIW
jgi:hypothetical protein